MTENEAQPQVDTIEPPVQEPPPPPPARPRRNVVPLLYVFGFIVLAGAMVYLWQNPANAPAPGASDEIQALGNQLNALQARVARLEQRPAGGNLDQLSARVDVLEKQPAGDLGQLTARVDALEKRPAGDAGPLAARVAVLEQKAGGDSQLAGRVDALSGRIDALSAKEQSSDTALTQRIDAEAARVSAMEKTSSQVSGLADRATRLARVQAAQAALELGQPLGGIPGAPSALARFATEKPPTEASLRLGYPAAERAALAASSPDTDGKPFLDRVLARAQDLVTIRQGDHVIVGDEAAGILARARTAVTAGDLPTAVAAVSALHGAAAAAMADWLGKAQALLAARAALADMAAHA